MGTVTLDKGYFETLLRRAQFYTSGIDFTTPVNLPMVTIPKVDHDSLLTSSREYENLRRNLYNGGISDETLVMLIRDDPQKLDNQTDNENYLQTQVETASEMAIDVDAFAAQQSLASQTTNRADKTFGSQPLYVPRNGFNGTWAEDEDMDDGFHGGHPNADFTFESGPGGFNNGYSHDASGQNGFRTNAGSPFQKNCKRTVQLCKLPPTVTYAEIVDVVRGGMIIDVYLRSKERSASVSFLEAADAQNFFRHVKRNDLYIGGKRVEIRWNDRQFALLNNVAHKVSFGATRNLVIRNCAKNHTEQMIRDDLEHIHNLVVIKVTFIGQNAHISTNSVHNAMFARTCMISRAVYKGSKIEWDHDECAEPIKTPQTPQDKSREPMKHKAKPPMNRFEVLNQESSEEGSEADAFDDSEATFSESLTSTVDALAA